MRSVLFTLDFGKTTRNAKASTFMSFISRHIVITETEEETVVLMKYILILIEDTHGLPPGMGASAAGPIGGRRGSYANAALAEYPARPYAS